MEPNGYFNNHQAQRSKLLRIPS